MAAKRASGAKKAAKRRLRAFADGVDRAPRQWHSATTGHAMTVAVGDGRGFSSLAAAPDGRAPSKCAARSWPVQLSALKVPASEPIKLAARSSETQNVKPEDGTAAVTAESLSRLASVGLRYGFFIGCLGPVDDEIRTARYARRPPRQAEG
ncbi:hypothetical protein [Mesorhizobium sp. B2-4-6]|uniref:hypothetical protein n=1 Tax=Mesorhizobium sp. B2-4-6 TaxID=2589943 RepID=UPI0015E2A6AA|nr:hypothetical protein [Mesorhizobium sp. B2-4-6]